MIFRLADRLLSITRRQGTNPPDKRPRIARASRPFGGFQSAPARRHPGAFPPGRPDPPAGSEPWRYRQSSWPVSRPAIKCRADALSALQYSAGWSSPWQHDQQISGKILSDHEPCPSVAAAADAQPPALAKGVIHQAVVLTHHAALFIHHFPRRGRQVLLQKALEISSPMQHTPVESFFCAVLNPASLAMARTCALVIPPTGNRARCSCAWSSMCRK